MSEAKTAAKPPHGMPRGASVAALAEQGAVSSAPRRGSAKRRDAVAQGLSLGFPVERSSDAEYGDPVAETQMVLTIDQMRPYDRNPRRTSPNPNYHEIKESIRSSGLHHTLRITRRPGEELYMIEAGGNTRLQILRELWEETRDEKFYRHSVVFTPWKAESRVLAKHLIENNVRGDMTFWDNAEGFMDLKALLEQEAENGISLRQFEDILRQEGVPSSKSDLARFSFAVSRLFPLGPALPRLTARIVSEIQPRFNLLKRFAEKHSGMSEDVLYEEVLGPAMIVYGERIASAAVEGDNKVTFDTEALMALCEESLATRCEVELTWLQMVLDGLKRNPDSPIEDLVKPPAPQEAGPAAANPEDNAKKKQGKQAGEEHDNTGEGPADDAHPGDGEDEHPAEASPPAEYRQEGGEQVEPASSPRPTDEELLPAIVQDVRLFAGHVDVLDALRHDDALPFGFWVDVIPLDPSADSLKHIGWWVLCTLSGQLHGEFTQRLPEDATWRNAMESDQDAVDHTLGGLPDFLHFHHIWALDGFPQDLFEIYLRLLGSMRWLKALYPERFGEADVMGGEE